MCDIIDNICIFNHSYGWVQNDPCRFMFLSSCSQAGAVREVGH